MHKILVLTLTVLLFTIIGCTKGKPTPDNTPKELPTPKLTSTPSTQANLQELYRQYRVSRDAWVEDEDWEALIELSPELLALTKKLDKPSSYAWQLNNSGWYFIELFKKTTDYNSSMSLISELTGDARKALVADVKPVLRENMDLLKNAKELLLLAYKVNSELTEVNTARNKAIDSNLSFINWVENFVGITH